MPRYFFHLRGEDLRLEDCEGTDLPNLQAALEEVLRARSELAGDAAEAHGLAFEVPDTSGRILLKVPVYRAQHNPPLPLHRSGGDEWRSPSHGMHLH